MKREDILHLADLARIELSEEEVEHFSREFDDILGYVDRVKGLAGKGGEEKLLPPLHNVFREDADPHAGGAYTEDLLNAAPSRDGQYVKVKKILGE